jgi:hypothetical protein
MSGQTEHPQAGHGFTAVLGGILLLAEIPIRLLEHYHLLHALETNYPTLYALLVSPSATVVRWTVGVLMILWVIVEYRKQRTSVRPLQQPAAPPAQPAAPPHQIINFNPVIQNVQNAPPVGGAAGAAQPAPGPQPQVHPPEPRPNLIFLQTRVVPVTFDNAPDRQFFYESRVEDRDDPRAVLACFRNEPAAGRAVADAERVRAQVVYRNQAGNEVGVGNPRACWLDEFGDMVDFPMGDSHCAILVIMRPDGQLLIPQQRRARANDGLGGDVLTLRFLPLNEAVSSIEVRLLDDEHGLLATNVFDFASGNGRVRIEPRPAPA